MVSKSSPSFIQKYSYRASPLFTFCFIDNREKLEVHEEVILERIHDALSVFAAKVRKHSLV